MTTLGKLIFAVVVIVLAVLAFVYFTVLSGQKPTAPSEPAQQTATTTPIATIPALDKTYLDSKLSFSIMYPATAASSTKDFTSYLPLTQSPLNSFVLPSSMFAGTNLLEAGVYVGASASSEAITGCTSSSPLSGETAGGTETINGTDFYVYNASDAGAGNFYESKIYRRLENGWCVEVVELLHSGNINNYTSGTVTEFDRSYFESVLDAIVHSYRSIPTGV